MQREVKAEEPKNKVGEDQTYKAEIGRDKEGRNQDDKGRLRTRERTLGRGERAWRQVEGTRVKLEETNARIDVRLGGSQVQDRANARALGTWEDSLKAQEEFARQRKRLRT